MCLACVSVGKRPLFDWLEQNGYLAKDESSLPKFAKLQGRVRNFWADLLLETAMIICFTHHTFMIPLLVVYYALDTYYFQKYVQESLDGALSAHFLAHTTPKESQCGKNADHCGCGPKLPEKYEIGEEDQSQEAKDYRKMYECAEKFSDIQRTYTMTNAAITFTILGATLLLAPEISIIYLGIISLARYPISNYLFNQQSKVTSEYYDMGAATPKPAEETGWFNAIFR